MSGADLFEDDYPHGTVDGFNGGCRGGACPAATEHGMSCKRAKALSAGDIRYNRLVALGKTPAQIAAIIDGRAEPAPAHTTKPVPRAPKPAPPAPVEADATPAPGGVHTGPVTVITEPDHPEKYVPTPHHGDATETPAEESNTGPETDTTATTATAHPETASPTSTPIDQHNDATKPLTTEKYTAGLTQRARTFVLRSIREWARANGFPGVPTHGKIPQDALAAFDRAHPNGLIGPEVEVPVEAEPAGVEAHAAQLRAIREWARKNGYPGVTNLTLTDEIRAAYDAAHSSPLADDVVTVAAEVAEHVASIDGPTPAPDIEAATPLVSAPEVGMRAWVRYDDGVAVVRAVERHGNGLPDRVRVTFLPSVRDTESYASIDWLNIVSEPLPVDVFTYDHFPNDGQVGADLEEWERQGRTWTTRAPMPKAPTPQDVDDFAARLDRVRERISMPVIPVEEAFDLVAGPLPRAEWAAVAISEDVDHARRIAAHLEAENARMTEELRVAHTALETTLRLWAEKLQENELLQLQLLVANEFIREQNFTINVSALLNDQQVHHLQSQLAAARAPWWKRATR